MNDFNDEFATMYEMAEYGPVHRGKDLYPPRLQEVVPELEDIENFESLLRGD